MDIFKGNVIFERCFLDCVFILAHQLLKSLALFYFFDIIIIFSDAFQNYRNRNRNQGNSLFEESFSRSHKLGK